MFVGHYAASLAAKKYAPDASLGWLFIAAQLVDIFFFSFVLMGVERFTIAEGATATNHFHLDYMPFTHSLLSTFLWAALAFGVSRLIWKERKAVAWAMAAVVASHWFFDLPVHTPDLPLWSDDSTKLGFGLWNYRYIAFGLEVLLLAVGSWMYLSHRSEISKRKRNALIGFVIFMLLFHA
ncbi:MAG: hypothetical protein AAFP02_16385, partial [Bacteroidota bacterium]